MLALESRGIMVVLGVVMFRKHAELLNYLKQSGLKNFCSKSNLQNVSFPRVEFRIPTESWFVIDAFPMGKLCFEGKL